MRLAGLVLVTLPFALVGAVVAAFLNGGVLSLGSLVGLNLFVVPSLYLRFGR